MNTVCFTSFTFSYLPRARVLAETLRAAHPGWQLWAVVVDQPPPGLDPAAALAAFDGVIPADSLPLPPFPGWIFRHGIVEACTAVKGAALLHLLRQGADQVVYFDPDIAVFHPLTDLCGRYAAASVVLTPHQIEPNSTPGAIADNEGAALRYGVFNLGFLAVRNTTPGRAFAAWWAARLQEACFDEPERGVFTDQKYCDLAPALFDGVAVAREPGWNVASWNLSRRAVRVTASGGLEACGAPLCFYHFTKFGGAGDAMTERYAGDNPVPHELWRWYGTRLAAHAEPGIPEGWWHYGTFADGVPVPQAARLHYRQRPDLQRWFADPFAVDGHCYRNWLEANAPAALAGANLSSAVRPIAA